LRRERQLEGIAKALGIGRASVYRLLADAPADAKSEMAA